MNKGEIEAIVSAVLEILATAEQPLPEYQWLFTLVGVIKGRYIGLRSSDIRSAQHFEPVALAFAEAVFDNSLDSSYLDWKDSDAVLLEFYKAWRTRRLAQGSNFLESAIGNSRKDWLQLNDKANKWVARVANTAFLLQEYQPEVPFLIPVNEHTAELFGTSLRTLSLALNASIQDKFIRIAGKSAEQPNGWLARRLAFNYAHPLVKPRLKQARADLQTAAARQNEGTENISE